MQFDGKLNKLLSTRVESAFRDAFSPSPAVSYHRVRDIRS